ncbi:hypothetical protein [Allohahella marinimesophila]|uniref:Cytoplasmic protein n=1 Tax=Allohahella marinimesophila TaxID=1054972 RepID=A0ABP7NR48_9GAMM
MSNTQNEAPANSMDADHLYQEAVFTDQKVGTIRRMTPVTSEGENDPGRTTLYFGQAQMMTPAGAIPLNFELKAESLSEAVAQFADAAQQSMQETMKELQEYRRQQASSIVVPGQEGVASPGGLPGSGKIQLR